MDYLLDFGIAFAPLIAVIALGTVAVLLLMRDLLVSFVKAFRRVAGRLWGLLRHRRLLGDVAGKPKKIKESTSTP